MFINFSNKFCCLILLSFLIVGCGSQDAKKMKNSNFPVRRTVGWEEVVADWETVDLKAAFEHENFNMRNAESAIDINAEIKIDENVAVRELFINQRYVDENGKRIALIEIIPCFTTSKASESRIVRIELTEPVENRTWGENYYMVKMGKREVNLTTQQSK